MYTVEAARSNMLIVHTFESALRARERLLLLLLPALPTSPFALMPYNDKKAKSLF